MTIFRPRWQGALMQGWLAQLLGGAHAELTRQSGQLRDLTGVDIWTESPSDDSKLTAGVEHYSLEGWRVAWRNRYQAVNQLNTDYGTDIAEHESGIKTAMDGLLTSLTNINAVFVTVMANYEDAGGNIVQQLVSDADRLTLADAIDAELEP